MRRAQLIIAGVIALTGLVVGGIGFASFVGGAAVAEQTGNQGAMGTGVMLVLAGLFLAVSPVCWVISRAFRVYGAAKHRMSPEDQRRMRNAETLALTALAVGGYALNREAGRRIADRCAATDAAAQAASQMALAQGMPGMGWVPPVWSGGAGQPGTSALVPGQHGLGLEPTPGQWAPHGE